MIELKEAWDSYLFHLNSLNKSDATIRQYRIDGSQFLQFARDKKMLAIDGNKINALLIGYREVLQVRYTNAQSMNRKLAAIRGFIQFTAFRGWLEEKTVEQCLKTVLLPVSKDQKVISILSKVELQRITNTINRWVDEAQTEDLNWLALRNQCLVETFLFLGLKPIEAIKMKWEHILFHENKCVIIKENKSRQVTIPEIYCHHLRLLKDQSNLLIGTADNSPYIWTSYANQKGKAITVKTIERVMQHLSKDVGFKVTATSIRYAVVQAASVEETDIVELLSKFGYSRKWILEERTRRFE